MSYDYDTYDRELRREETRLLCGLALLLASALVLRSITKNVTYHTADESCKNTVANPIVEEQKAKPQANYTDKCNHPLTRNEMEPIRQSGLFALGIILLAFGTKLLLFKPVAEFRPLVETVQNPIYIFTTEDSNKGSNQIIKSLVFLVIALAVCLLVLSIIHIVKY